jgi:hypothetical protein
MALAYCPAMRACPRVYHDRDAFLDEVGTREAGVRPLLFLIEYVPRVPALAAAGDVD